MSTMAAIQMAGGGAACAGICVAWGYDSAAAAAATALSHLGHVYSICCILEASGHQP